METRGTIAILFHESTPQNKFRGYRIWHCAQHWLKWGFDVQIVQRPDARIEADLLIPHIDLSVFPREYRPLLNSASTVLNRNLLDIRKSAFSRNLVSLEDEYDGPVIVKTNCNYGGQPEKHARRRLPIHRRISSTCQQGIRILRQFAATRSLSKLAYVSALCPHGYPVYQSKHQVPSVVFGNADLVVERFLPEKEASFYYLRSYAFLGDAELAIRVRSEHPVVKGINSRDPEFVPVDESIVAARRALGLDHGKMDYVLHNGKAVLLDVNTTPTFGRVLTREIREQASARLARGIRQWFPDLFETDRSEIGARATSCSAPTAMI